MRSVLTPPSRTARTERARVARARCFCTNVKHAETERQAEEELRRLTPVRVNGRQLGALGLPDSQPSPLVAAPHRRPAAAPRAHSSH